MDDLIARNKKLISDLERLGNPKIMVVGDFMLDEYIYGEVSRISPEAPVPVVREINREYRLGGAGNVSANLIALGASVCSVGVVGLDNNGKIVRNLLEIRGVKSEGLLRDDQRPTTCKSRVISSGHQMLRIDKESSKDIDVNAEQFIINLVDCHLYKYDLICVQDYGKGVITERVMAWIVNKAKELEKTVIVDPAINADYYKYTSATIIKPNRHEAEKVSGIKIESDLSNLEDVASAIRAKYKNEIVVLTLDKDGICFSDKQSCVLHRIKQIPVHDVTGAGDMVLAILCMTQSMELGWDESIDLANFVGRMEVSKFGCVPFSIDDIISEIKSEFPKEKRLSPDLVKKEIEILRRNGNKIVFTNGCFDIIHKGHIHSLNFAKKQGDILIVGVNSDESISKLKGQKRPINLLEDRITVLAGLESVDYIVEFTDETPIDIIKDIIPDVIVKGEEYRDKEIVGSEIAREVILCPMIPDTSTTKVLNKLEQSYAD